MNMRYRVAVSRISQATIVVPEYLWGTLDESDGVAWEGIAKSADEAVWLAERYV